jgi:Arylsulfatase A and related enzymes
MSKNPNILWITSDQQRWDTIHSLGNKYIDTPNLDRLCKEGVAFTNTYCQCPICTPSRASFLTGRYPSSINSNINGASNLPEHCTLISKRLADAGYNCGLIGKLHITSAWDDHEDRMDDGYSYFEYNLGPGHDLTGKSSQYAKWLREKGVDWHDIFTNDGKHSFYWYKDDAPLKYRQTAWCAEKAIEFMKNQTSDRPWLLCVNSYDPHPPFDAHKSYVDKYLKKKLPDPIYSDKDAKEAAALKDFYFQSSAKAPDDTVRRQKASYYGMVEISDYHLGVILDALESLGLKDETVVIYNSDHGESLGDHGYTHKGCRFYEGLVHVPLIISCPSRFEKGISCKAVIELNDIVPTIGELCNVDVGRTSGYSLVPVLEGNKEKTERCFARTEYYYVLDEGGAFGSSNEESAESNNTENESYGEMFFDGRYKLSVYHGIEHGELYDLLNDSDEEHNLWDDEAYAEIKVSLLLKCFEVAVKQSKPGQTRRGRY